MPSRRASRGVSFNLTARMTKFVAGFSPRTLAYGASVAALAIVLQAGILAGVFVKEGSVGDQVLASAPQSASTDGSYVRVSFKPDATAAAITAFLNDNKAVVVEGPQAGFFRVRVAEKPMSKEELAAAVKKLAANPVVSFTARRRSKARSLGPSRLEAWDGQNFRSKAAQATIEPDTAKLT